MTHPLDSADHRRLLDLRRRIHGPGDAQSCAGIG